jgi:hypothetical protein
MEQTSFFIRPEPQTCAAVDVDLRNDGFSLRGERGGWIVVARGL